jgi:hypothetical protein
MAYRRSSYGRGLLSSQTSPLILSFPLSSAVGGGSGTAGITKTVLEVDGSVSGMSYIPKTSLVGWALLN